MRISDWSSDVCSSDLLLVSGDDEAERAVMVADPPGGGDKGGDRALHVHRATAMEHAARDLPGERLLRPAMADRHDVSMAGKGKMAAARPTSREQILDRSIGSLAERHTPDLKADALHPRLPDVHRTLVGGGEDWKSVVSGTSVTVGGGIGGRRIIQ